MRKPESEAQSAGRHSLPVTNCLANDLISNVEEQGAVADGSENERRLSGKKSRSKLSSVKRQSSRNFDERGSDTDGDGGADADGETVDSRKSWVNITSRRRGGLDVCDAINDTRRRHRDADDPRRHTMGS